MRSFFYGLLTIAPLFNSVVAQIGGQCAPQESQPNPIGRRQKYATTKTTGTVNGTAVILPIALTLARSIIPAQYKILKNQYKAWLPSLAADQYPVCRGISIKYPPRRC